MSFSRSALRLLARPANLSPRTVSLARRFDSSSPLPPSPMQTGKGEKGELLHIPPSGPSSLGSLPTSSDKAVGRHRPSREPVPVISAAQAEFRRTAALLTVLLFAGLGSFVWATWEIQKLFNVWPKELRDDLRNAIRDERREEWARAEAHWRTAWTKALSPEIRPKLSLLHLTGLASSYVDLLLTRALAPQRARPILLTALAQIDAHPLPLTGPERQRRIAILSKLGEVAEKLRRDDEEEKYLTKALEDALRAVVQARKELKQKIDEQGNAEGLEDLPMPDWLSRTDVGVCCDNLAGYYMRQGNGDYASALYLHAINVTLPPAQEGAHPSAQPSPKLDDRCRAAQLMTNLANSLIVRPSSANLSAASVWAIKALNILEEAQKSKERIDMLENPLDVSDEDVKTTEMCDRVKAVALFNLGMLASMEGKSQEAYTHLKEASEWSRSIGYRRGEKQAQEGMERIRLAKTERASAKPSAASSG